jgi:uncharacterized Zn finger protein
MSGIDDETLVCPMCDSERVELLGEMGNRLYSRCRDCGTITLSPGHDDEEEEI